MDYMGKNKENLVPEFREYWQAAGGKASGTWTEVFGDHPMTNEIFMAWYYALYEMCIRDRYNTSGRETGLN